MITRKDFLGHVRKCSVYSFNILINNSLSLFLIGALNKRFHFIRTVFVAYPATEKYVLAYVYRKHIVINRWKPWPLGLFKQNGSWGLTTGISSTEKDFVTANSDSLNQLYLNAERIKNKIGADQMTFAGILPSVLNKNNICNSRIEADVTVAAVLKALNELLTRYSKTNYENLIILGAKGFIGSNLVKKIFEENATNFNESSIYMIDIQNKESFPYHLKGSSTILINLTRKSVLMSYQSYLWKELIILNEVYPAPNKKQLKILSENSGKIYHIVGIEAQSYPAFPKEYKGGIPCCAAWNSEDMEVILKRLN